MKHYSRQREVILKVLRQSKSHPTAKQVFEEVRQEIPNISLGTVYRNLAELSAESTVLNLKVGDGVDRYDGDTLPHIHLYCNRCGRIIDLPLTENPALKLAAESGFTPESLSCVIGGICADCTKKCP